MKAQHRFLVWDPKLRFTKRRPPKHAYKGAGAVLIYLLIDPRDGTARYVGVTNDLARRFTEHMKCNQHNSRLRGWVQSLKDAGLAPKMLRVGRAQQNCWEAAERAWIKWLRANGGCYNIQNGGMSCFHQQAPRRPQVATKPTWANKDAQGRGVGYHDSQTASAARRKFDKIARMQAFEEEWRRKLSQPGLTR